MNTVIRFENVSKRYDLGLTRTSLPALASNWLKQVVGRAPKNANKDNAFLALNDVSFELGQGQSLALVGPNGAGKTTILKLLSNITKPTSGNILTKGQLSALIELGAGFHPDLTGRENIYLNGTILGIKRKEIERRFDEIVDFADLEHFIDTPVKRYSSGMTVRLGFSIASCIEPDVLLVDEVLAVGDASFRQKCIKRIKELQNNGTSLVFVSHNMGLVKAVCDTAIYIEHGRILEHGNTSMVIDVYNSILESRRVEKLKRAQSQSSGTGTDIEIMKIEVVGLNNQLTAELNSDKPAEIRVHYIAYGSIGSVNLLIRIYRADGISCCLMRTSHANYPIVLQQGLGIISVNLEPIQLFGGSYFAVAWVMDKEDINGLARGSSEWFQVKNPFPGLEFHDAVFEPNRRWQHYQLEDQTPI